MDTKENSGPEEEAVNQTVQDRRKLLDEWKRERDAKRQQQQSKPPAFVVKKAADNLISGPPDFTPQRTSLSNKPKNLTTTPLSKNEPLTPTAQLARRIRALSMVEASPTVKLGRRIQALRSNPEPVLAPLSIVPEPAVDLPTSTDRPELDDDGANEIEKQGDPINVTKKTESTASSKKPRQRLAVHGLVKLQVVSKTGEIREETQLFIPLNATVRKAAAAPLFTLQTAANLAKIGEIEGARFVFECLATDATQLKQAMFWITWARFEESCNEPRRVVDIYERASAIGAEPISDVSMGLRWFLLRTKDEAEQREQQEQEQKQEQQVETLNEEDEDSDIEVSKLLVPNVTPVTSPTKEDNELTPPFLSSRRLNDESNDIDAVPTRLDFQENDEEEEEHQKSKQITHHNTPARTKTSIVPLKDSFGDSSRIRLAEITPSKHMRERLGAEVIITPVRRSTRTPSRPRPNYLAASGLSVDSISDLPDDLDYVYIPNRALPTITRPTIAAFRTPQPVRLRSDELNNLFTNMTEKKKAKRQGDNSKK